MSILNRELRKTKPTHPGKMLREDFMPDYNLTVKALAEKINVSRQTINELVHERRNLSPEMALRLSSLFGNTPEFWLNAQREVDLWHARSKLSEKATKIKPLRTA